MNTNQDISKYWQNDTLLAYIHEEMTDEARHDFEQYLATDVMLQEALEGLRQIEAKDEINRIQVKLQDFINHKTQQKINKRERHSFRFIVWVSLMVILLLIAVIGVYIFVLGGHYK